MLTVSPVTPPMQELVLPIVKEVTAAVGEKALEGLAAAVSVAALPVALTLALILPRPRHPVSRSHTCRQ